MMNYKDAQDNLYSIEPEFEHLLPQGCTQITNEEAEAIRISKLPVLVPPTVAEIKATKWIQIKLERDRRESGGYLVGGTWYHSDPQSLMKYNTLLSMAIEKSLPASTVVSANWKDMSGSFSVMTVAKLREIRDVGVTKISQIYTAAETHRVTMELSETPETYDYLSGWPTIFGE
jgi:hypothetical protein